MASLQVIFDVRTNFTQFIKCLVQGGLGEETGEGVSLHAGRKPRHGGAS